MLSFSPDPVSVVAFPVLVTVKPWLPVVRAERSTARPSLDRLSPPSN